MGSLCRRGDVISDGAGGRAVLLMQGCHILPTMQLSGQLVSQRHGSGSLLLLLTSEVARLVTVSSHIAQNTVSDPRPLVGR